MKASILIAASFCLTLTQPGCVAPPSCLDPASHKGWEPPPEGWPEPKPAVEAAKKVSRIILFPWYLFYYTIVDPIKC